MELVRMLAKKEMAPQLKALWKRCFDEGDAVLAFFFEKMFHPENTLVFAGNGQPVAALYLLPCWWQADALHSYPGNYIYAVATHPAFRRRGLSSQLLEWANECTRERGGAFTFLVPSSESLFHFYQKAGFVTPFSTYFTSVDETDWRRFLREEPLSPPSFLADDALVACRQKALLAAGGAFIQYPKEHVWFSAFLYSQYGRQTVSLKEGEKACGYAICEPDGEGVLLKEAAWMNLDPKRLLSAVGGVFPKAKTAGIFHGSFQDFSFFGTAKEVPLALATVFDKKLMGFPPPYVGMVLD